MELNVPEELEPYLEYLAEKGVLGATPEDVGVHLLRESLAAELRGGGLLRLALDDARRQEGE